MIFWFLRTATCTCRRWFSWRSSPQPTRRYTISSVSRRPTAAVPKTAAVATAEVRLPEILWPNTRKRPCPRRLASLDHGDGDDGHGDGRIPNCYYCELPCHTLSANKKFERSKTIVKTDRKPKTILRFFLPPTLISTGLVNILIYEKRFVNVR